MKNKTGYIFRKLLVLVFMLSAALTLQQCSKEESNMHSDTEEHHHEAEGHEKEIVMLSKDEMTEFGIEIATAGPGKLKQHLDLTGEIVIDPDRLAHIVPRFAGIVKQVNKKIGDRITKGETIATIESNESLSPYEIKSMIDGQVIDMHLTLGEVISDRDHEIILADLSKVWANLTVYQKDLDKIRVGQKVTISATHGAHQAEGVISYISPVISEQTRTAIARVVLDNRRGIWRPGLFVTGKVIVGEERVSVLAPKTALENYKNNTVVFVKQDEGFAPQPVKIARSNSNAVEIVAGLKPGQVYVSKSGFTLKAELQKEAFGEGHAH